jgi:beta-glucosidase
MRKKLLSKSLVVLAGVVIIFFLSANKTSDSGSQLSKNPIYLNTSYSFEERAADLVSRLTLEEKESLLGNNMAAVPRLGINSFNVWSEALHGVMGRGAMGAGAGSPTSFPNSVALGSSWDPSLMQRETNAISDEARAINSPVISGLTFYSPVVEPIRDPRWGRTGESYSEDPFLISQIAGGFIRGMMGSDATYLKTVPCGKHYFANNSEFDRHTSSSNMDTRDMREFYLAPYKKLIEKDKLPSVMSSYNAVNGIPTSASKLYLDTIVRRTYGLKGYITGDCSAIEEIYTGHNYVKDLTEAAAAGLKAGVDIDCGSVYQTKAIEALNRGSLAVADMDRALLNIFTIRMRLGEFDPASKVPFALAQPNVIGSPANKALAKEIATKTPVLLKNNISSKTNRKALPVNPAEFKRIALIGPQVDRVELGPYSGRPSSDNMVSPLAGIKKYITEKGLSTEIVSSTGATTTNKSNLFYVSAFELRKSNGVVKYDATKYTGSSKGITVGFGMGTLNQVRTIDDGSWTSYENIDLTNVDTIGINVNITVDGGTIEARVGSPEGNLLGTLNASVGKGARAGGAYGAGSMMKMKVNKLGLNGPQTLYLVYKALTDLPIDQATIDMAASADAVIMFVGTDEKTATEEADRLTLLLPGNQVELIKKVAAANPNTIVVMQTLGCVEVEEFKNLPNIPGIIFTGYNGQAQGDAIASVLFGDVNPGGKLNATWYKTMKDLPEITDYTLRGGNGKNGRTYWYFTKDVSYEFGYGLSYTTFEYSNFKISRSTITPQDKITVSVDVKNTGAVDGDEIVQVYMRTPDSPASLQRPVKRLKGFQRVTIASGMTRTVKIDINCADLWFWDMAKNKMTFDQGKYIFEIGASSKDIKGSVTATMNGAQIPVLKTVVAECGTVVLRKGSTVKTSVTAAMTDDSFYDISKATVTYTTSNPAAATVDDKGIVTAKGVGVATITTSVTIGDVTESSSYPVKIMPDLNPASITVDNKPVKGFSPDVTGYSYLMAASAAKAPVVAVTPADPAVGVETVQAKGVPGSASITITDYVTVDKKEFSVNFGIKSVSDEFNAATLGSQWSWLRENKENWSLTKTAGSLQIKGQKGDLLGASNTAENILVQSANTDWTILSKVSFNRKPTANNQQGGLIAMQDEDNFVKIVYRANARFMRGAGGGAGGVVDMIVEKNGINSSLAGMRSPDAITDNNLSLILKLERKGGTITGSYSRDGKTFTKVGTAELMLRDTKAGVIVCNGEPARAGSRPGMGAGMPGMPGAQAPEQDQSDFNVMFDYFRITNTGLK